MRGREWGRRCDAVAWRLLGYLWVERGGDGGGIGVGWGRLRWCGSRVDSKHQRAHVIRVRTRGSSSSMAPSGVSVGGERGWKEWGDRGG